MTYTSRSSEFSTTREQSSLTEASMGALWRQRGTVWVVRRRNGARCGRRVALGGYLCVEKASWFTRRVWMVSVLTGFASRKSFTVTLPSSSPAASEGDSRQGKPRRHWRCHNCVTEHCEATSHRWQWHFSAADAKPQRWGRTWRNPRLGSQREKSNSILRVIQLLDSQN